MTAQEYISLGLSCLPCNKQKAPAVKEWKQWQTRLPNTEELELFNTGQIGVICGDVSGGLEVIDIDSKYHAKGIGFNADVLNGLDFDPCIVQTRSGGIHIYYRTNTPMGNTKIAGKKEGSKVQYFIESRGNGGYVIAPPSEGYTILHGSFDKLPVLPKEQRDEFWDFLRSFNEHFEKPHTPRVPYNKNNFIKSPLNDYNDKADIVSLLEKHGWKICRHNDKNILFTRPGKTNGISASVQIDTKLFYVFTSNSIFDCSRAYMPYQVLGMLEYSGNYTELAKALLAQGYGVSVKKQNTNIRNFVLKKQEEGVEADKISNLIMAEYNIEANEAKAIVDSSIASSQLAFDKFWHVKTNEKGEIKITIKRYTFAKFLNKYLGLSLFFGDKKSSVFRLILDKDGLIEECTSEMLKKRVITFLESELPDFFDDIHKTDLCEILMRSQEIFSDKFYEFLDHSEFDIKKDEKDTAYFFFSNTIAVVKKDGISTIPYGGNFKVWKSQVNDWAYFTDTDEDCHFKDFCFKLAGQTDEKFNFLRSIIGYALHRYKDPTNAKALIICEEIEDSNKGGGSGKSILIKAISKMVDGMIIDGEMFDPKQPFALQRYKLGQSFIAVEDAAKNMSLKHFKSLITEGITIDKKNKDQLYLPYRDAPKWFFTTNYNIGGVANYEKRRVIKFGVEPFFGLNNLPNDFYKHYFFEDWDKYEWNKFFNFMLNCVKFYMNNGIVQLPSSLLNRKALITGYTKEFTQFIEDFTDSKFTQGFKEVYQRFLDETDLSKQDYNIKRFKSGVEAAIELLALPYEFYKDKENKNKIMLKCTLPDAIVEPNIEDEPF